MKKKLFLIISLLLLTATVNYANLKLANYYTFNLEFAKALEQIKICKENRQTEIQAYYYENYVDFLEVVLTHDKEKYENYTKKSEQIYSSLENLNLKSPHKLYVLSQIKFNNSVLNFLFGSNFSAAWDLFSSYKLHSENLNKFPTFSENTKQKAIFDIVFSSIPSEYKWIAANFGIKANLERGLLNLKTYSDSKQGDTLANIEPILIYSLALMHFSTTKMDSYDYLKKYSLNNKPLLSYVYCLVAASNDKNDEIISFLETKIDGKVRNKIVFFDFLLAKAKLNKLDFNAEFLFEKFLKHYTGSNYLKVVYQRLAWVYLLKADTRQYLLTIKKAETKGQLILEQDKQASSEILEKEIPNTHLLAARLLFDGAYYNKALLELIKSNVKLLNIKQELEYYYRFARIYHKKNDTLRAIEFYKNAILLGSKLPYYFAPYSALNIAQIYVEDSNLKMANYYFEKALLINNGEYKSSIELKAKIGLENLKKTN